MAEIIKKKISELKRHSVSLSLVSIALIIAISGMFVVSGSLGWYAHNDQVSADGMSVDAKSTPNLVIGKSPEELSRDALQFEVSFETLDVQNMVAVTRDESCADTYLKHLTNHYAVDAVTGKAKDGMALEFEPVPAQSDEVYFVDYTVYIAARFDSINLSSLTASISSPTKVDDDRPYFNAASIDFYVGTVSLQGYRGTTSVSDSLNGTGRASIELLPNGDKIPLASDGYVKVIMRCYFDGALLNPTTGNAYVNSQTVKSDNLDIGVTFTALDAVSE